MQQVAVRDSTELTRHEEAVAQQFVSIYVDNQLFGIPVLDVHDVIRPDAIFHVPLAPKEVAGALNLRGKIVTAIDIRTRLDLPTQQAAAGKSMCVVVESSGELYSLVVDTVGEVLDLYDDDFESTPSTLDPRWREVSKGVYRLHDKLLVVLDINRLLRSYESK